VTVRFRLLATLFAVAALAGCGGSSAPAGSVTGSAYIRFLNGSPDQTAVDFDLPAGTRYSPDLNYGVLTAYQTINAGTYSVGATPVGSTNAITYTIDGVVSTAVDNSLVVAANHRYTVVLGGSKTNSNLQLCIFDEPLYKTGSTSAAVQFNNCSPTFSSSTTGTIAVGYYSYANSVVGTPVLLTSIALAVNSGSYPLPASAANGIGFYANGPTIGSILPKNIDANDTTNALPFVSDQNASIFVLDGPIGGTTLKLVGAFDPDN
jgi:hypothetical protein